MACDHRQSRNSLPAPPTTSITGQPNGYEKRGFDLISFVSMVYGMFHISLDPGGRDADAQGTCPRGTTRPPPKNPGGFFDSPSRGEWKKWGFDSISFISMVYGMFHISSCLEISFGMCSIVCPQAVHGGVHRAVAQGTCSSATPLRKSWRIFRLPLKGEWEENAASINPFLSTGYSVFHVSFHSGGRGADAQGTCPRGTTRPPPKNPGIYP